MSHPSDWPLPKDGVRFLTPDFMRKELRANILTRDCFPTAVGYYPSAFGHQMQRQQHDDNLLIYCVAGQGSLHTESANSTVRAGDVVIIPQGVQHQYAADPNKPWTIYWCHFTGETTRAFIRHLGYETEHPISSIGISPTLTANFTSLLGIAKTGYSAAAFIHAANQLRQILTFLASEMKSVTARSRHNFNLRSIHNFMLEQIGKPLDLDSLAATSSLSKYHFSSKYKKLTGYPPIKHFLNMKIEHACHLLDSSPLSVKEIAAQVGYDDALYFSRLFRKTMGLSPSEYRRSIHR